MSDKISTYSFLPWLRQGIANNISSAVLAPGELRAKINVQLELAGVGTGLLEPIDKDIQLVGPGDIIGVEGRSIVRTEPRDWITNFEPNYLPLIEFYDEDFPWRYTPAAPDTILHRLQPWIMLVVLKEGTEFEPGRNIKDKPLPYIELQGEPSDLFPPSDQLWAWAHIHVNRDINASEDEVATSDVGESLDNFQALLDEDPDLAYSRILCPRKLEENTAYHAFLIPTFESGRLAGLGLDVANAPGALYSAFEPYPSGGKEAPTLFPYYHRWYFRTSTVGDFEYLVGLLEPKPVDKRVGRRDMDVQNPYINLTGITDADPGTSSAEEDLHVELGGVLKLGGALQVPFKTLKDDDKEAVTIYNEWSKYCGNGFISDMTAFINLSDDYALKAAETANSESGLHPDIEGDPDPIITPPLYGRWHSLTERLNDRDGSLPLHEDNWVHELNLDPRFRVSAAFGTNVMQKNQEEYMNNAWEQVGEVLEANRRIRQAQFATAASYSWYNSQILPLHSANFEKGFMLASPLQKRIMASPTTVFHKVNTSVVPYAVTSQPARRIMRPRGRMMKILALDDPARKGNLITRINDGEVHPAPPKKVPEGATTLDDLVQELMPKGAPSSVIDWLRRFPLFKYIPLFVAMLIVLLLIIFMPYMPSAVAPAIGIAVVGGSLYIYRLLSKWSDRISSADSIREENQTPESIDKLPKNPGFVIGGPGGAYTPGTGGTDSVEAARLKAALKDSYLLIEASKKASVVPIKEKLDLAVLTEKMTLAINPERTIPRKFFHSVILPPRLAALLGKKLKEVMAYPVFDTPMYLPLAGISSELFLPNINYIEQNCISLLETNQKFIEAYMVGLNPECARELLWREYPTDQRGSCFRQFWDVSGFFNSEGLDDEALKEKLRDIKPIDKWKKLGKLGDHDNREEGGDKEEEVVLVIRGELLKKYPTAVIYAHRAEWQRREEDDSIDNTKERRLVEIPVDSEGIPIDTPEDPLRKRIKTPLYEAKVEPDIYFFGFDLKAEEAQGETGEDEGDDPGWFFVIKERPGEPRFGLDISQEAPPGSVYVWNDLSWAHLSPPVPDNSFININNETTTLALEETDTLPGGEDEAEAEERLIQHREDELLTWNKDTNSADLAYILYQVPVMVAVHASEMLPK